MSVLGQLGMQVAAAGIGTAMNRIDEKIWGASDRKKQLEQQQKLTDMQVGANKELADYGMGISKEMFEATGYGAQRRQMEEAGLNPALMYGHAGAGGSTSSASAGTAGIGQASDEASRRNSRIAQQGMALQMGMQQSQIELNKAQATKLLADAKKTSEVDTDLTAKQIENIIADINNKEVQKLGMLLQNKFDEIRNEIKEATAGNEIRSMDFLTKQAAKNLQLMNRQIDSLDIDIDIKDRTREAVIESVELQNEQMMADILVKESQGRLNDTQARTLVQQIGINLSQLGTNIDKNAIEREMNEIMRENNITSAGTNAISSLTNIIVGTLMLKGLGGKAKPIKGFGK